MTNILKRGQNWLTEQLQEFVAESVVYWRGVESVAITATVGRSLLRLSGDGGMMWTERDYIFPAADLVLGGGSILPEIGDLIRHTLSNGVVEVYEVLSPGGEPHFRFSDNLHSQIRVHCKKIAEE